VAGAGKTVPSDDKPCTDHMASNADRRQQDKTDKGRNEIVCDGDDPDRDPDDACRYTIARNASCTLATILTFFYRRTEFRIIDNARLTAHREF